MCLWALGPVCTCLMGKSALTWVEGGHPSLISAAHNASLLELCLRAIQKQAGSRTWPGGHSWLTPALDDQDAIS